MWNRTYLNCCHRFVTCTVTQQGVMTPFSFTFEGVICNIYPVNTKVDTRAPTGQSEARPGQQNQQHSQQVGGVQQLP